MTLVFLGNSALRRVSKSVANVRSPVIRRLLEALEHEVRQEAGIGIAAPQVGHNLRMFLMLKHMPENEEDLKKLEYQKVLNPDILAASDAVMRDFEGCLSVPGYQGIVKRAQQVLVQYEDGEGRQVKETLTGFPARVFQHELDHLNGVMYLDRMEPGSLIHNEEFEAMEWDDIQQLLLQGPGLTPPPFAVSTATQASSDHRKKKGKGIGKNKD
uniref:Peptide deformylase n=1 Tax=Peronospora matthiolae TaxID=2874970 RepID=A0AAV1U190_9STRA